MSAFTSRTNRSTLIRSSRRSTISLTTQPGSLLRQHRSDGSRAGPADRRWLDHKAGRQYADLVHQRQGPARTRWHNAGSPGPLRKFKGHMYEGGIRVPGIIRWPGHIKPGTVSDIPVCGTDFLPTVCDLVEIAPPTDRTIDGESVTACSKQESSIGRNRCFGSLSTLRVARRLRCGRGIGKFSQI